MRSLVDRPIGTKMKPQGKGARDGGSHFVNNTVRAKRNASTPEEIAKKYSNGEPYAERGFARLSATNTRILAGEEDLSEWDNEELRRGYRRNKNGGWSGRKPVLVPRALHDEAVKRIMEDAQEVMRDALVPACRMLAEIFQRPDAEDKDKIKAAQIIMDRVLGKPLERVEVTGGTSPWEDAIVAAVVPFIEVMEVQEEVLEVESK